MQTDNVTSMDAIRRARERFKSKEEPKQQAKPGSGKTDLGRLKVGEYLDHYGVRYVTKAQPNRTVYPLLDGCLFDSAHTKKEAAIVQSDLGMLTYQCFHESCNHTWQEARQVISNADSLAQFCEGYDPNWKKKSKKRKSAQPDISTMAVFNLTDLGNAERFQKDHAGAVRYCYPFKQWYVWDNKRWQPDTGAKIVRLAKATVRRIAHEVDETTDKDTAKATLRHAIASEKRDRLKALIELGQSEEGIPVSPNDLDADQWKLNVQNGTIDLKTGNLLPHTKGHLITKIAPIAYDPAATCPRFMEFIGTIMEGRQELIRFLQKLSGYSMTGDVSEQIVIFFFGTGENGKTTLIEIMAFVLGDYAQQADIQTFILKRGDQNSGPKNDIAILKGARFVSACEPEINQTLAESIIKQLTGQDRIKCRFLYKEQFEYLPTYKLFLSTNHRLRIRGTDHAIWRRIREIPFAVKIPKDKQDKHLGEKLREEASGILNWMIEGCLLWQAEGLGMPDEVAAATSEYRAEQDPIGAFLADCCLLNPKLTVTSKALRDEYKAWCEQNGERTLSAKAMGGLLRERGCQPDRSESRRGWQGIGLLISDNQATLKPEAADNEMSDQEWVNI